MNTPVEIIDEISGINRAIGAPDISRPVYELLQAADKSIFVAVLGQFKSGKSSLINSLIGEDLLPVGVLPLTAIVTRLRYGIQPRLIIRYLDKREDITLLDVLPAYVTENLNPGNARKVAQVIIEHPGLESFRNINLVDTPGLGSFYRHNTETTNNWLPFTGMGIISVSAERPLSEEDLNLIKETSRYCPNLAIVITKADLVNEKALPELSTFIQGAVDVAIGENIPVFTYSIIKDQEGCRSNILNNLLIPLNLNSDQHLHRILQHKLQSIIKQSRSWVELALRSAMEREAGKDSVTQLVQGLKDNFHHHQAEMLLTASSFKGNVRTKLEKIYLPLTVLINQNIISQFNDDYNNWHGSLSKVSGKYESWIKMKLRNEIASIDTDSVELINQISRETANYFQYVAGRFRQMLDDKLFFALGVHLSESDWQIEFPEFELPDISIYRAFDTHLDMFLFFLPMAWFRKFFENHFRSQIPIEIEKNLYRHMSDLTDKINKATDIIHKQALNYISREMITVENILESINTNASTLNYYLNRLDELKSLEYA